MVSLFLPHSEIDFLVSSHDVLGPQLRKNIVFYFFTRSALNVNIVMLVSHTKHSSDDINQCSIAM